MKITFFVRRFYPEIGGVEKHVFEVARRLIKKRHEVIVVCEASNNSDSREKLDGIEIIKISVGANDWFKKIRIWKKLWKFRKAITGADVIHCHDVFFWYLPFRFLFPGKKVYTTFHGYETVYPPRLRARVVRKLSEIFSKGNICIGDFIKKWYGTIPDFVTYGGVSATTGLTIVTNTNPKLKIILIGRLDNDIGIRTYLKSLDILKKKKIKINFETYGEGSLRKYAEKYGKVNGFITDIQKVVDRADIIFCSSYLTILESLVRKKIVIAVYDNPLKEDYLKMSPFVKFIYICKSPQEVADVVLSVQASPWKSNTMINMGHDWAKGQTWERTTSMYLKLWEK